MVTADKNPFRVQRIEALAYRAPAFSWDAFLRDLKAANYRGAIVGPHGTGKTTLLLELQQRLEADGVKVYYGFLNEETPYKRREARRILASTPADTLLFLDGAEQLDPLTWQWIRWRSCRLRGLVITTHTPGRLPTLYRTTTDEATLRILLKELYPTEADTLWPTAQSYFERNGGNIREVFFALYDDCARG